MGRFASVIDKTSTRWLVRVDDGTLTPLIAHDQRPAADPLRDLLATGVNVEELPAAGDPFDADDVRWLPPVSHPGKIIAVALNYRDHAREAELDVPTSPIAFTKTPNTLTGHQEPVNFARENTSQVDYEAELGVIIGRRTRGVPVEQALESVFGYTVCNDISARDAQFADNQWFRGKSYDTFCPLGPSVVTRDEIDDPQDLAILCRVDGVTLQESSTAEMIFSVADLISYFSRFMTLEPGDVIATGTPHGVGFARTPPIFLRDGNVVESEVEMVGVLSNPIVEDRVGLLEPTPAESSVA